VSTEILKKAIFQHAESRFEGMALTVFYKGKVLGVDFHPDVTKDLLAIDTDPPEGQGIPLHNFIQRYLTPALAHLKAKMEAESGSSH
jgi:hypothetical protein